MVNVTLHIVVWSYGWLEDYSNKVVECSIPIYVGLLLGPAGQHNDSIFASFFITSSKACAYVQDACLRARRVPTCKARACYEKRVMIKVNFKFYLHHKIKMWGWRIWQSPAHFISSPRPTPRRKKCPRTNEGNLDCQNILPMTTLSSTEQDHRRGRCHVARGSPLEDPKGDSKPNGSVIGAW